MSKLYRAARRLALTADKTRVVLYSSKEAGYLFAAAGDEISAEDVARYNIPSELLIAPASATVEPLPTTAGADGDDVQSDDAEPEAEPTPAVKPPSKKRKG